MKQNSFKAWILASRPKTLTGAAMPVIVGMAMAAANLDFNIKIVPAVLCLLFALLMQIDANFVNDYFDWRRGNDDEESRLGPLRACSQGWVSPKAMVAAMVITTVLACFVGLPLVFYGGWEMILVGVACVIFCVLYTTTLSYIAMGDILVLVFFGIVPVCLTYYLQCGTITFSVFLLSLAVGLCVDTLLIVNNYRDIDNDRRDGKRTLIVFVGKSWGLRIYLLLGVVSALLVMTVADFKIAAVVLMLLYLFLHRAAFIKMSRLQGRELNLVLGLTARNIFIFGLLTAVALIF